MTGTLRTGEEHRATSGEEAISAYLAWRKRHLVEPGDGQAAVRLVLASQQKQETSVPI